MRLGGTAASSGTASAAYVSTTDRTQPAAAAATLHEKNDSSDSLASNNVTGEERDPLVVSSRNRPYLDYGASGVPALRIENLSKVSVCLLRWING